MAHALDLTNGYADINGAHIAYEVAGDGHPLVLIHAGIADSRMWDDLFPLFAERYRTLRYDLRGFGRSNMPPGPYSHADDLAALLAHLDIGRAYLLGVSLGGQMALDFTLEHPDVVAALITSGASISGQQPSATLQHAWAEMEHVEDLDAVNELELRLWVDGPGRSPEQVALEVRGKVRLMNGANLARESEQESAEPRRLDPPAITRLDEIRVPLLTIVGQYDVPDKHAAADLLVAEVPGARKAVIPDTAHVPSMERPDIFASLIFDFLEDLE